MEVKGYFQRIRSVEESLPGDCVVVVSLATPDGGRDGRSMELTRALAAKMIVDKKAKLASEVEAGEFRKHQQLEFDEAAARESQPQAAFLVDISAAKKDVVKGKRR